MSSAELVTSPSSSELLTSIEAAIRGVVNNQKLTITAESRLIEDLGLESIDLLDVSSELENSLGWELDFREVAETISKKTGKPVDSKAIRVQDLMDFIAARTN